MANTVHGLTAAIVSKMPGMILQTGCGGGFGEAGLQIGDVVVASAEIDAQLGVAPAGPEAALERLPFPVLQTPAGDIFNRYPVDAGEAARAVRCLEKNLAGTGVNVFKGAFVTVATVTASAARARRLHRHSAALLENMEGAGSAHVAALYAIPFLEIRAVSNRVGDRDKSRWDLPLAFQRCSQAVRLYLEDRAVQ
jgi:futalosine hydrolase